MKKLYLIFIISSQLLLAQETSSFQPGEWLKFELNYSGWLKAGNATLEVFDAVYRTTPVYKVVAKGWTTGPLKWIFKVEDHYESHIDMKIAYWFRCCCCTFLRCVCSFLARVA